MFWAASSVQFSCSVVSDSLRPHGLQYARLPYPSPAPGVYPNSCPLSWWCHPLFLQSWASTWRSSSQRVNCSQLSDSRQHSSHSDSSTFCSHYRARHVFILRSQCLNDHQLTGSACGFQNAILSSKYSINWRYGPGFYRLRVNSEIST